MPREYQRDYLWHTDCSTVLGLVTEKVCLVCKPSTLFLFAVHLANPLGFRVPDSPRQRQHSVLHAANAAEADCSDVQHSPPGGNQSPGDSVTTASVYKVTPNIECDCIVGGRQVKWPAWCLDVLWCDNAALLGRG